MVVYIHTSSMVECECGCHIGKPTALCVTGAKKRRGFKITKRPEANVNVTAGRWAERGGHFKKEVTSFFIVI